MWTSKGVSNLEEWMDYLALPGTSSKNTFHLKEAKILLP